MFTRRNPILTFALCTSLMLHGLALAALAWWAIDHTPPPRLAAIDRTRLLLDTMRAAASPPPPALKKTSPPQPPKKKPAAPKAQFEKPQDRLKDDSGEAQGIGTANRSTDGATPMQANEGYEQADLMQDADKFAADAFLPASKGETEANNAAAQKSPKSGTYTPDFAAESKALADAKTETAIASAVPPQKLGSVPLTIAPKSAAPAPSGTKDPVKKVPIAQLPTPKPVLKEIHGHRATASDTESVAFAKTNSVSFHAGKVEGRKGLKVKSTLPRWGLASEVDMQSLGGVHTLIGATVDADGNVLDVQILRSSGSNNIDQDCKNCVWDWVLEPQKDKDGHPTDLNWTISFE